MTPRRLLTADRRAVAGLAVVTALCIAVVALLGAHYAHDYRAGRLDSGIDRRLRYHLRSHIVLLNHLVDVAPAVLVLVCLVMVVGFATHGRPRAALLTVFGPGVAIGLTEVVLKPLVGRRLRGGLSFPSGHTTGAVATAVVLVVFLLGPSRPMMRLGFRLLLCLVAAACAVIVATALVGAGDHYATDTLGGLCTAIAVVLVVSFLIDTIGGSNLGVEIGAAAPNERSRRA
jgi:membrane-associated phospholipid phosphatase